jgi:acyl-CoA thioester hydrolase
MADADVPTPADYPLHLPVQTRWADNDLFGHLNNAYYYAIWDSCINRHLALECGERPLTDPSFAVVAESSCRYLSELSYPDDLVAGLGIHRLGSSSVTYRLGLWRAEANAEDPVAAFGRWVHVYVARDGRRATPMPERTRAVLSALA